MLAPDVVPYEGRVPSLEERREHIRALRVFLYVTAAYIGGLCVAVILANA